MNSRTTDYQRCLIKGGIMFSSYDHRPTNQIVDYLMSTNTEEIDLLAVVTVLARRIDELESKLQDNKPVEPTVEKCRPGCFGFPDMKIHEADCPNK